MAQHMESTSYQTYLNKKKHHKVDKYFLKQKRRNGTEPIEPPACEDCGVQLTVKHIITECLKYKQDWQTIGLDSTLDVALGLNTEENAKMLQFLKTTGLYNFI